MNEETTYYEDILFEELTKDKDRRRNILIDLNVALQKYQRVVANIKDFREIQEYKIAVVSIENELKELQQENQQLKEQYCERTDCSGRLGNSKKVEELEQEKKQLKEQLQQKEDIINKVKEFVKKHNERAGKLYYKYDNKYLLSEIKEDLLKILDNKGE